MSQVQNGLPRGVAGAHDRDVVAAAPWRLASARAVVDAAVEQLVDSRQVEASPFHPRRSQSHGRGELQPVGQLGHRGPPWVEPPAEHAPEEDQLRAELLRLASGQARQLRAADSLGEAEKVFDHGRVRSLAAGDVTLENHGRELIRGCVDGCGETRPPGHPRSPGRSANGSGRPAAATARPGSRMSRR